MLESFLKYIKQENLAGPGDNILLGISGGIDSMVMLKLFELAGLKFSIAHCNFGLRGEESDKDQEFIENYARQRNLNFFVQKFETSEYAELKKISIQMAARNLRINWFKNILKKHVFNSYATAHHLDDQAETFFINLMRGTGLAGLHGILPKQGNLIHPLLFTNRESIIKYAKKENIPFREDSSNKTTKYLRNKIRHQLIPLLNEIKPGFNHLLVNNIKRFRETESIYKREIKKVSDEILNQADDNAFTLNISAIKQLPDAPLYLYETISEFGFNYADAEDLIKSLNNNSGSKFYSATHRIVHDRDIFLIQKTNAKTNENKKFTIEESQSQISEPLKITFDKIEDTSNFQISPDPNIAFLDYSSLSFPLKIRKWKKGDHFFPLGMKNKKLLSDFFIDNKLSIYDKENTWLLTSGENIIWIIGHRIDNRFKLTNQTSCIYKVSFLT